MSGASGGGQLATVSLITALTSITNAVAVSGIAGTVTVNGSLTSVTTVGSITNTVDARRNIGSTIQYSVSSIPNATATLVTSATTARRSVMIKNITPSVTFYIGSNASVTAANGFPVEYGEVLILDEGAASAIYAYQNSGSAQSFRTILETD